MKWRALFALLALGGIALVLAKHSELRSTLLHNRATYLINQGKYTEAQEQLETIRESKIGNARTIELLAEVEMNQGEYTSATEHLALLPDSPRRCFLQALCFYEQDREPEAEYLFRKALESGVGALTETQTHIARLAVNRDCTAVFLHNDKDALHGTPPEQMLQHSLEGRASFALWDFKRSSELLESARALHDKNSLAYLRLYESYAILNDYPQTEWGIDRMAYCRDLYEEMAADLDGVLDQFTTGAISMRDMVERHDWRGFVEEAMTWAKVRDAIYNCPDNRPQALALLDNYLAAHRTRLQAMMVRGELLESMGRERDAFVQYEQVFRLQPGYGVLLRMKDLAGETANIRQMEEELLRSPSVREIVPVSDIVSSSALSMKDFLAFFKAGTAEVNFSTACAGEYEITMVARCDRAFNLGALIRMTFDGNDPSNIYVAREGWDCYPVRKILREGSHHLKIEYLNNSERLLSPSEDRNFYLQRLIISSMGSREFERAGKP